MVEFLQDQVTEPRKWSGFLNHMIGDIFVVAVLFVAVILFLRQVHIGSDWP